MAITNLAYVSLKNVFSGVVNNASIDNILSVTASNILFEYDSSLTGNDVAGTLIYKNASNTIVRLSGIIKGKDVTGSTLESFAFYLSSTPANGNAAYLLQASSSTLSYNANGETDISTNSSGVRSSLDSYAASLPKPTITVGNITADNIINGAEAVSSVTITGSVAGDATAGDTVTLVINGQEYSGVADVNRNFSISSVLGTDLTADTDLTIEARVAHTTSGLIGYGSVQKTYTVDTIAPSLSSSTPADDSTGISISNNISLIFNQNISAGTGSIILLSNGTVIESFDVAGGTGSNGGTISFNGTTGITVNPIADLSNSTGYYINIDSTAVKDSAGNFYAGISNNSTLNFTTIANITNSAPVLTAGNTLAYQENGAAASIDSSISITDSDDANLVSATVSITNGFTSGDLLNFTNQNGITGSFNSGTGVLTLTGSASKANYQTALRSITYSSSSDNPTSSSVSRTVSWAATDANAAGTGSNGALSSTPVTSTINVTAINDAPSLTTPTAASYTDSSASNTFSANTGTLSASDPEGSALTYGITGGTDNAGVCTLSGTYGSLSVNITTGAYTYTPSNSAINSLNSNTSETFTVSVSDGTATTTASFVVNITGANDAPTLSTTSTLAYTENGAAAAINSSIVVGDLDNTTFASATVAITGNLSASQDLLAFTNDSTTMGNIAASYNAATGVLTLTSASASATLAQWQAALRSVTYANSSDNPSTSARSVTYTVNDGTTSSSGLTSTINITSVNDAPSLTTPAAASYTDTSASNTFSANTGTLSASDPEGSALTYGITSGTVNAGVSTLSGTYGSLSVTTTTGAYTYSPSDSAINALTSNTSETFTVSVSDGTASTTASFVINLTGANDTPSVANAIPNQNATEDSAFSFQFAANDFADVDAGDTLTYSATLADGNALPSWLSFNAATRTFSGTPLNANVGTISVKVTATDVATTSVFDVFDIIVANTNDAPTVANALLDQSGNSGTALSYQFAANTFQDVDAGTSLTYAATLADGSALPSWLSFDGTTRTFSGTPTSGGTLNVKVVASDGSLSVDDTFDIAVTAPPPPPADPSPPPPAKLNADLNQNSDTGASNNDRITSDIKPNFDINAGNLLSVGQTARLIDATGQLVSSTSVTAADVSAGKVTIPNRSTLDDGSYTYKAQILDASGRVIGESLVTIQIVTDKDGIMPSVELAANGGDYNKDGVQDWEQANVTQLPLMSLADYKLGKSAPQASFGAMMVGTPDLTAASGVKLNETAQLVDVKLVDTPTTPLPTKVVAVSPMFAFTVQAKDGIALTDTDTTREGLQVQTVISLPKGIKADAFMKFNSATQSWYNYANPSALNGSADGAAFRDINGDGLVDQIVITVTDGGVGDEDGLVNGAVVDPGMLADTGSITSPISSKDKDGVSSDVELASGNRDFNLDGLEDWDQGGIAQLPLASLDAYLMGKDAPPSTFGFLMVGKLDSTAPIGARMDVAGQLQNITVSAMEKTAPAGYQAASPVIGLQVAPAAGAASLTDVDPTREGLQTQVIEYFATGVKANAYMLFDPISKTWFDYTDPSALNGSADGAALLDLNADGLIDAVVVTVTDNGIADDDITVNGIVSLHGMLTWYGV